MRGTLVVGMLVTGCSFTGPADRDGPIADARAGIDALVADAPVDAPGEPDAAPDAPPDAAPDATPDASPDAAGCPADYAPLPSGPTTSRYRTGLVAIWLDAEHDCEDDGVGTHLVVIDDAAENAAIDALVAGGFWMGVTDLVTEGTFLAVTGGPATFLPWGGLQPDDFFGEDCVIGNEQALFQDVDCGDFRAYVCECDGVAPDPTAY